MSVKESLVVVALCAGLLGATGSVRAEGLVQKASKDAVKGAVKGAGQELNSGDLVNGAKQVTKGMMNGVADSAPLITSQIVNQADVNKKAIGKVTRQITAQAVAGAMGVTISEMNDALGPHGEGPLATAMAGTSEKVAAALTRGIVSQIHVDTEKMAADAVRGAMSQVHVDLHPWVLLLVFVLGGVSTLFCGVGLMLLYLLFQRRQVPVVVPTSG